MKELIDNLITLVEFPLGNFEGLHPLYRQGEVGDLIALVYADKEFNPRIKSSHALLLVRYEDGTELLVPVAKHDRYRIWFW